MPPKQGRGGKKVSSTRVASKDIRTSPRKFTKRRKVQAEPDPESQSDDGSITPPPSESTSVTHNVIAETVSTADVTELALESQPAKKTSQAARRKKKETRAVHLNLTDEQETDLADWLKDTPYLYTKGSRSFRNSGTKTVAWDKKAKLMNVDSEELFTWYKSIRTRVGKLTGDKSGQAPVILSDRDQFILNTFRFLSDHIVRVPSRVAVSVSILQNILVVM